VIAPQKVDGKFSLEMGDGAALTASSKCKKIWAATGFLRCKKITKNVWPALPHRGPEAGDPQKSFDINGKWYSNYG
jgi:hypothetical protein